MARSLAGRFPLFLIIGVLIVLLFRFAALQLSPIEAKSTYKYPSQLSSVRHMDVSSFFKQTSHQGIKQQIKTDISDKYNVEVFFGGKSTDQRISFDSVKQSDEASLELYSQVFMDEFSKYPPEFIRNTGLEKVYLVTAVKLNDKPVAGTVIYNEKALVLNITSSQSSRAGYLGYLSNNNPYCDGETEVRSIVHHELFHLVDFMHPNIEVRKKWLSLNPDSFEYRNSKNEAGIKSSTCGEATPGFASQYASLSYYEDRAVTFSTLMTAKLAQNREQDKILESKQALLKKQLRQLGIKNFDQYSQEQNQFIPSYRSININ